ncbi:MAG: hypothetical protein J6S14_15155 [Clostridia bacterium]|nr:hypothetical protein [Clostridia bacterium]
MPVYKNIPNEDLPECRCGFKQEPVWFIEEERDSHNALTGRTRRAVSHFECPNCGRRSICDDSFDGDWH